MGKSTIIATLNYQRVDPWDSGITPIGPRWSPCTARWSLVAPTFGWLDGETVKRGGSHVEALVWWILVGKVGEMRWIEMNWDELRWIEMNWDELRWIEMNWDELRWIEMNWDELRWIEMNWDELRWTEMNWDELSILIYKIWGWWGS